MRLDATDKERLADAIRGSTDASCNSITVSFRERRPIDDGWDIAALQDDVNAACAGTDAWGYIVPLLNAHEYQMFSIIISRRPR
jgi:hypothetical protein